MESKSTQPIILKNLFDLPNSPESLTWEHFRQGVKIHRLYGTQDSGPSAALLWYEKSSGVPRHEHLGWEHILILSNHQDIDRSTLGSGTLLISPPGTTHAISVPDGAIVLAIWERPVRFLG